MKKIWIIFIFIFLFSTGAFSQIDTTDIAFYPLHTGNYWEYQNIHGFDWGSSDTSYFSLKIIGDTIFLDSMKYKIIEKKSIPDTLPVSYIYERVDTLTLNTYRFGGLLDSLRAQMGDTVWNSIRGNMGYLIGSPIICSDVYQDTILNVPTFIKRFYDYDYTIAYFIKLAKNLGLIHEEYHGEWAEFLIQRLVFAKIKGNSYGTPLSIVDYDFHPEKFELYQNYPNPFNPVTTISFNLPQSDHVKLTIFDVIGRTISDLVNEKMTTGEHSIKFNASKLSSGVYFYRLEVGHKFVQTKKMIVIR
jgi:hypothetical protein